MKTTNLTQKKCIPCSGDTPTLPPEEVEKLIKELDTGWEIKDYKTISKKFKFKSFKKSMEFVNEVADIAEEEGHHPDIAINYSRVTITLTTHAIQGLSENDFILAAKIDKLID